MRRILYVVLTLLVAAACDPFATTNSTVDEATAQYEAGDHEAAEKLLEQAREEIPERAELHYDIGLNLLAQEKWEEAEVAFSRSLETAAEEMRPMVLANLGLARLQRALTMEEGPERKELLAGALDVLEKAVSLRPDLEPARRNLELVLLYLFPPCSRREDAFEPNERPDQATDLAQLEAQELLLCPDNLDLYRTELEAGDRFTVTVTQVGDGEAGPPIVEILDSVGAIVGEGLAAEKIVTGKFEAQGKGAYFIKVRADDDEEHPYRLTTEVLASCKSLEDGAEENDSRQTAATLPIRPQAVEGQPDTTAPPTSQLRVCPGDPDWFTFDLQEHESILFQIEYEAVAGDLTATLVDGSGQPLARVGPPAADQKQEGKPSSLTLSYLDMPATGPLYLELAGSDAKSEATARITAIVRPPCPAGDDSFEANDSREAAHALTPPAAPDTGAAAGGEAPAGTGQQGPIQHLLRRCPGNDDWFSLEVKKDAPMQVQIGFDHERGDLSLEVYAGDGDAPEQTLDESSAQRPGEGTALAPDEDTTYLLRVTGAPEATNFYQLSVQPAQGDSGGNNQDQQDQQDKQDEEKQQDQEQEQQQQEQPKAPEQQEKPIEQMMEQLDQEQRPNLEAERTLRQMPNIQAPGGRIW
jgi:hypothetical protein